MTESQGTMTRLTEEMAEHLKGNWVLVDEGTGYDHTTFQCRYCSAPKVYDLSAEIKHAADCILKKLDRLSTPDSAEE